MLSEAFSLFCRVFFFLFLLPAPVSEVIVNSSGITQADLHVFAVLFLFSFIYFLGVSCACLLYLEFCERDIAVPVFLSESQSAEPS